jgi:Leucine-rich repeat (LRR) protein
LCSHNFIEVIPPEIGRLKNLTIFSIASNRLTQLPVEMSGLISLKSLDVCKNSIQVTNNAFIRIPRFVSHLSQVLPPELGLLKDLRKLDIAANPWIDEIKEQGKKGPDFLLNYLRSDEYDAVYFKWMAQAAKKAERE